MNYDALSQRCGLTEETLHFIETQLLKNKNFTKERIKSMMETFFGKLGIDEYYFQTTPPEVIARHLESLRAAEVIALNARSPEVNVDIRSEKKDETFYLVDDTLEKTTEIELRIDRLFGNYRLQSYRTLGRALGASFLRMYFVYRPTFSEKPAGSSDFTYNMNLDFLKTSSKEAIERYEQVYNASKSRLTPYVVVSQKHSSHETRIMVSLPPYTSEDFLSKFSGAMTTYGLYTNRKYVEPMRDGRRIFSFYLKEIQDDDLLEHLKEDIGLISFVGETPIDDLFINRTFTAGEYLYAFSLCQFTYQFIAAHTEEIEALKKGLAMQPELHGILRFLKLRLVKDTYTLDSIFHVVRFYPDIIKNLYKDFQQRFDPEHRGRSSQKPLENIRKMIELHVSRETHKNIVQTFLGFNPMVLKTNFYKKNKTTIAFRLLPGILDPANYPDRPFGIFFIVGKEFLGFHVRFRDIARGGVRIVRSRTDKEYDTNLEFIFDENYRLALTQQKKNKDIPEGGAKGAILLGLSYQNLAEVAFQKYIDGLLDLLIKSPEIIDYYGKEEIIFLGPDEGTAELMDWASQYAKENGYNFWKSFTTGKSLEMGGIPHDFYGMTTAGVHEYEIEILKQLGLNEKEVTKVQTGGPDGDLGSNEILVSKSRYLGVVDASGVLYDSKGIDREELVRLAKARLPVKYFSRSKVSQRGFLVLVDERSVNLFDGTTVANGTEFRNHFHLTPYARADIFVPCGGRPQSIHILNWKQLLNEKSEPAFKVIVEGANLFITHDACLELEKRGCIIIKDASANKGGVTSSSLEVLALLSLTNDEYDRLFIARGGRMPAFRKRYVAEIIERIRHNARREFNILWHENREKNIPLSILSDRLSEKINRLRDVIHDSYLFERHTLRKVVISRHVPKVLLKRVGIDTILKRVPETYQRSIFATTLASDFVYTYGLEASEIEFSRYVDNLEEGVPTVRLRRKDVK